MGNAARAKHGLPSLACQRVDYEYRDLQVDAAHPLKDYMDQGWEIINLRTVSRWHKVRAAARRKL